MSEPVEVGEIVTTQGRVDEELEDFFGDGSRTEPEVPVIEKVEITVRLFDERGAQTVRPRYVRLIRKEGGRWYIYSGATLTF